MCVCVRACGCVDRVLFYDLQALEVYIFFKFQFEKAKVISTVRLKTILLSHVTPCG